MRLRTTSTQRTYRYVRLSMVGATVLLAAALVVDALRFGVPSSVSAAYYTSAGPLFVGSLCAVALALVALSGRSVEQGLLDVAAIFALVVAVVPTPVTDPSCPGETRCVPAGVVPTVVTSGAAVAVVVVLGLVTALVLARVQGTAGPGTTVTLAAVTLVALAFGGWAVLSFASFLRAAHVVAAVAFFVLIGVVAGLAAWRPQRHPRRFRMLYVVVAIGMALALVGVLSALLVEAAGVRRPGDVPWVLICEAAAVGLFAAFWLIQTVELWNDPDPAVSGARGGGPGG